MVPLSIKLCSKTHSMQGIATWYLLRRTLIGFAPFPFRATEDIFIPYSQQKFVMLEVYIMFGASLMCDLPKKYDLPLSNI